MKRLLLTLFFALGATVVQAQVRFEVASTDEVRFGGQGRENPETEHFTYEQETVTYSAQGLIRTADGQEMTIEQ